MTEVNIYKKLKKQFLIERVKCCESIINNYQKEYDIKIHGEKARSDKTKCLICGGKYTRHQKSKHMKTKKHLKIFKCLRDNILED